MQKNGQQQTKIKVTIAAIVVFSHHLLQHWVVVFNTVVVVVVWVTPHTREYLEGDVVETENIFVRKSNNQTHHSIPWQSVANSKSRKSILVRKIENGEEEMFDIRGRSMTYRSMQSHTTIWIPGKQPDTANLIPRFVKQFLRCTGHFLHVDVYVSTDLFKRHCNYFYRTRVRSLAMLVSNSLTH